MPDSGLIFPPAFRLVDAAIAAVSGGKFKFYAAGTSTPLSVYSDATLTTSLGSTVYTDSAGHPVASSGSSTKVVVYTGSALVKLVVTDADDVTIATYDNLRLAQDTSSFTSGGTGSGIVGVKSKTTDYSVLAADDGYWLDCDPTGGAFTITLLSASTAGDGFAVGIRHAGTTTAFGVLLTTVSGQLISGDATTFAATTLTAGGEAIWLVSNGATWRVISHVPPHLNGNIPTFEVVSRLSVPPSSPDAGAYYILTASPSGAWSTYAEGDLVRATGQGTWTKWTPPTNCGWRAYVQGESIPYEYRGSAWVAWSNIAAPTTSDLKYITVQYSVANGTVGGAASTSWSTRPLNTITTNYTDGTPPAIATNTITNVPAGTYLWSLTANFYGVTHSQARIVGSVDGTLGYTTSAAVDPANAGNETNCTGNGKFTLTAANTITVEDIVNASTGTNDRGLPTSFTGQNEVYLTLTLLCLTSQQGPTGSQGAQGTLNAGLTLATTLANGANSNIAITSGSTSYGKLRITGPTGAFSITGLVAPSADNYRIVIFNTTAETMTLTNDATSTAANRILTMTGADVALTGPSMIELTYDLTSARWIYHNG